MTFLQRKQKDLIYLTIRIWDRIIPTNLNHTNITLSHIHD